MGTGAARFLIGTILLAFITSGVVEAAPPIANPDGATTQPGKPVRIPVMTNDRDPDGDTFAIGGFPATRRPLHGTVAKRGAYAVYTPAEGFTGTDSFAYRLKDSTGALSKAVKVTINVTAAGGTGTGSAALRWSIPTTRENGAPITMGEIDGYEIYVLAESTGASAVIIVDGAATTSYTIMGLSADTFHFSMAAKDTEGNLSALSAVVSKTIAP